MTVLPFPQPPIEQLIQIDCALAEIKGIVDTLTMIDQVEPKGRQRRAWHNAIVTLHGFLGDSAVRALRLSQEIKLR